VTVWKTLSMLWSMVTPLSRLPHTTASKLIKSLLSSSPQCKNCETESNQNGIALVPIWVSREHEIITCADLGSRDFRSNDYSIDPVSSLESTYDKFTVDAMPNSANTVCSKFYSRYSSHGSSGVNFFAQTLSQKEYFYVFPPVKRAVDAIQHLAKFKCSGVLVIPVWPRSWIFSHFFPDGTHCAGWVV
jgi:hypothetical protein